MFGGVVLFPSSKNEDFINHKFYQSIKRVNIGALPFLPTNTKLIEEYLESLIVQSGETIFDKSIEYSLKDRQIKQKQANEIVLIGVVKHKLEQLKQILKYKYYHIPKSSISSNKLKANFIALFEGKSDENKYGLIRYYAKIKEIKEVKGKDLRGVTWNNEPNKEYYVYELENIYELRTPILNKERWLSKKADIITFRFGTLYSLLNANTIPELLITSERDKRLWDELKNRAVNFDVRIITRDADLINTKVKFLVDAGYGVIYEILSDNGNYIIIKPNKVSDKKTYHDLIFKTDKFFDIFKS